MRQADDVELGELSASANANSRSASPLAADPSAARSANQDEQASSVGSPFAPPRTRARASTQVLQSGWGYRPGSGMFARLEKRYFALFSDRFLCAYKKDVTKSPRVLPVDILEVDKIEEVEKFAGLKKETRYGFKISVREGDDWTIYLNSRRARDMWLADLHASMTAVPGSSVAIDESTTGLSSDTQVPETKYLASRLFAFVLCFGAGVSTPTIFAAPFFVAAVVFWTLWASHVIRWWIAFPFRLMGVVYSLGYVGVTFGYLGEFSYEFATFRDLDDESLPLLTSLGCAMLLAIVLVQMEWSIRHPPDPLLLKFKKRAQQNQRSPLTRRFKKFLQRSERYASQQVRLYGRRIAQIVIYISLFLDVRGLRAVLLLCLFILFIANDDFFHATSRPFLILASVLLTAQYACNISDGVPDHEWLLRLGLRHDTEFPLLFLLVSVVPVFVMGVYCRWSRGPKAAAAELREISVHTNQLSERRRQTFDNTAARESSKSNSASKSDVAPTPTEAPAGRPTPVETDLEANETAQTQDTPTGQPGDGFTPPVDPATAGDSSRPPKLVAHRSYAKKVYERSRAAIILTKNLLLNLLYAHLDKVTLVFLYLGGMQRMDGIHAIFLFFLFMFFTFSDFNLQRHLWILLVIYAEIVVGALYVWETVVPLEPEKTSASFREIESYIGLRPYINSRDATLRDYNNLVFPAIILMSSVLQLDVFRQERKRSGRRFDAEEFIVQMGSTSGASAVWPVLRFFITIFREWGLLLTYVVLIIVASETTIGLTNFIYWIFLVTLVFIHQYSKHPRRDIRRFWLLVVLLSACILIYRYLCQWDDFFRLLENAWPNAVNEYLSLEETGAINYANEEDVWIELLPAAIAYAFARLTFSAIHRSLKKRPRIESEAATKVRNITSILRAWMWRDLCKLTVVLTFTVAAYQADVIAAVYLAIIIICIPVRPLLRFCWAPLTWVAATALVARYLSQFTFLRGELEGRLLAEYFGVAEDYPQILSDGLWGEVTILVVATLQSVVQRWCTPTGKMKRAVQSVSFRSLDLRQSQDFTAWGGKPMDPERMKQADVDESFLQRTASKSLWFMLNIYSSLGVEIAMLSLLVSSFYHNTLFGLLQVALVIGPYVFIGEDGVRPIWKPLTAYLAVMLAGQYGLTLVIAQEENLLDDAFGPILRLSNGPAVLEWIGISGYETTELFWDFFTYLFVALQVHHFGTEGPSMREQDGVIVHNHEPLVDACSRLFPSIIAGSLVKEHALWALAKKTVIGFLIWVVPLCMYLATVFSADLFSFIFLLMSIQLVVTQHRPTYLTGDRDAVSPWRRIHRFNFLYFVVQLVYQIPYWTGAQQIFDDQARTSTVLFPTYQSVVGLISMCRNQRNCDDMQYTNPFSNDGILHAIAIFLLAHLMLELFASETYSEMLQDNSRINKQREFRCRQSALLARFRREMLYRKMVTRKKKVEGSIQVFADSNIHLKFNDCEVWTKPNVWADGIDQPEEDREETMEGTFATISGGEPLLTEGEASAMTTSVTARHAAKPTPQEAWKLWSVEEVCDWVSSFGEVFERYADNFRAEGVDGRYLDLLHTEDDFQKLVRRMMHRKRLVQGLEQLRLTGDTRPVMQTTEEEKKDEEKSLPKSSERRRSKIKMDDDGDEEEDVQFVDCDNDSPWVSVDALGHVVEWNAQAEHLFGATTESLRGACVADLFDAPPSISEFLSPREVPLNVGQLAGCSENDAPYGIVVTRVDKSEDTRTSRADSDYSSEGYIPVEELEERVALENELLSQTSQTSVRFSAIEGRSPTLSRHCSSVNRPPAVVTVHILSTPSTAQKIWGKVTGVGLSFVDKLRVSMIDSIDTTLYMNENPNLPPFKSEREEIQRALYYSEQTRDSLDTLPTVILILRFMKSYAVYIALIAFLINLMTQASLLSLVVPAAFFAYGLLEHRRPSAGFWKFAIFFSMLVISLFFLFQLPIFCIVDPAIQLIGASGAYSMQPNPSCPAVEPSSEDGFEPNLKQRMIGVYKVASDSNFAAASLWIMVCLMLSSWVRTIMKDKGVWDLNEDDLGDDYNAFYFEHEKKSYSEMRRMPVVKYFYEFPFQRVRKWFFSITALDAKNLTISEMKPGIDLYWAIFLIEMIAAFTILLGYAQLSSEESAAGASTNIFQSDRFSGNMVLVFFSAIFLIVCDRVALLFHSITTKLVLQFVTLIYWNVLIFFSWPKDRKPFTANSILQCFFIMKCIYWTLSAFQIRFGYNTQEYAHTRITERVSGARKTMFSIFKAIPFLFELRVLLDWVCVSTTLDLSESFKLEEIYSNVYILKCELMGDLDGVRGEIQSKKSKCISGSCLFVFLMIVILLPLLLFSTANPASTPNNVFAAEVNIQISADNLGELPILNIASTQSIDEVTSMTFQDMRRRSFVVQELRSDVQNITMVVDDTNLWSVSPPTIMLMQEALSASGADEEEITITFKYTFERPGPSDNPITTGSQSRLLSVEEKLTFNEILNNSIVEPALRTNVTRLPLASLFPEFFRLAATGAPIRLEEDPDFETHLFFLELGLDDIQTSFRWWRLHSVDTLQGDDASTDNGYESGMSFIVVNEQIFESDIFGVLGAENYGIITLYLTVVIAVGSWVRDYFADQMQSIIYDDMQNVDILLNLCSSIYIYRRKGDFAREESTFRKLIRIYRDPMLLLKLTRRKQE